MALDRDRLRKSVGKLRQFLKKQKSMTPEKIHQFRTQARRFEASVKALGSSTRDNEERLLRDLARLRKQAGRIRDMDVFTGWALTIRPEASRTVLCNCSNIWEQSAINVRRKCCNKPVNTTNEIRIRMALAGC